MERETSSHFGTSSMARWCLTVVAGFFCFFIIQKAAYGSGDPCLGNSCYLFKESGKTWAESQNTCKAEGGALVSIETGKEWQFIKDEIQKLCVGHNNEWYIGLKKEKNVWKWVSGSPLTISKWQVSKGQPSGDGDVAVMAKDYPANTQGLFNDLSNTKRRAFICEVPKAGLTLGK